MAFRLMMAAQKKWRKLDGQNRLPEIIQGVQFRDGSATFKPPPDQASPTSAHISVGRRSIRRDQSPAEPHGKRIDRVDKGSHFCYAVQVQKRRRD
jgi:hypothetical protein